MKYRAAELMAAAGACDPARWLANIRLMSAEVPLLPLKACDRLAICKCKYRHFDDRRRGVRREDDDASVLMPVAPQGPERRRRPGRRETDYK